MIIKFIPTASTNYRSKLLPSDTGKPKSESPKMGFDKFDRFEKRRGQKDDRKIKAAQSFFKVTMIRVHNFTSLGPISRVDLLIAVRYLKCFKASVFIPARTRAKERTKEAIVMLVLM